MKHLVVLLVLLLPATVSFAQDDPVVEADTVSEYGEYTYDQAESDVTVVSPKDTEAVAAYRNEDQALKEFDEKEWKAIVGDATFDEERKKAEKKEEEKEDESKFKLPSIDPQILRILSFTIIFILLAVIIYFVMRNTTFSQSIRKMKPADIAAPVENIEEVDIDALLKQALASGDLRAAVRVHYLMLLKKLNEVGLIAWKKDKTNRDYLSELYGRNDCYEDVRKLTLAYELVWYGERSVSQDSFRQISGEFESVNKQVTKDKPDA